MSSLTEFSTIGFYNQGYPTYTISAQNWGLGQAKITVSLKPFFYLRILKCSTNSFSDTNGDAWT
jgi:hypothetical protein